MKYGTRKMKQMVLFPELFDGKSYVEEDVKFPLPSKKKITFVETTQLSLLL